MSTKTSIKRIAAVAAVALTLGGFSAVSANAAVAFDTATLTSASTTGTIGTAAKNTVALTGVCSAIGDYNIIQTYALSVPATSNYTSAVTIAPAAVTASTPVPTNSSTLIQTLTSGNSPVAIPNKVTVGCGATGRYTSYATLSYTPDVAGTYTFLVSSAQVDYGSAAIAGASYTVWTLTVTAPTLGKSTAFIGAAGASEITADAVISVAAGSSVGAGAAAARIDVRQYSSTDTSTALVGRTAVTVAISGAGLVDTYASAGATRGPSSTATAADLQSFTVWSDGRAGTGTVTVSIGGVVVATKTLTFTGTLAKYALATTQAATFATYTPKGGTSTLTVSGFDANGNAATLGTVNAVSSNTAVATVSATDTSGVITVTGVTAGTANITLTNLTTAATVTLVVPVEVTLTTAKTVTITTDATSYAPGAKITLTVTATDSNGRPVADGARNLFSSTGITSDVSVGSATYTAAAAVTLAKGVATFTAYAPSTGTVTFSATQGAAVDAVIAGSTAAAITATPVAVVNAAADAAQAAVDAANEATDAANAATDAANNAMDSADAAQQAALDAGDKADAALAAVTDLASKVADIATQIAALSSLVSKIAASVAKISAKVKA